MLGGILVRTRHQAVPPLSISIDGVCVPQTRLCLHQSDHRSTTDALGKYLEDEVTDYHFLTRPGHARTLSLQLLYPHRSTPPTSYPEMTVKSAQDIWSGRYRCKTSYPELDFYLISIY